MRDYMKYKVGDIVEFMNVDGAMEYGLIKDVVEFNTDGTLFQVAHGSKEISYLSINNIHHRCNKYRVGQRIWYTDRALECVVTRVLLVNHRVRYYVRAITNDEEYYVPENQLTIRPTNYGLGQNNMHTYFKGDIVIFGDEITSRWGVIERLDYKDIKIGIRSYYTEEGHVDYWVRPECIIKCLNRYHVGDQAYCTMVHGIVEIIDIGKSPCSDKCWYKVRSVHSKAIYSQVEEEGLNKYLVESYICNETQSSINKDILNNRYGLARNDIDKVIFNDPATIIIWKDGTKTVVKTAPGETYSKWAGMALCISKKLYGDRFHRIFKEYCGEEEEKPVELTEREKAYIDNDIKACAEKRKDLNEEFAKFLDKGPMEVTSLGGPEYHANDYVHFESSDGFHFGRVMSYNPETMRYKVYELGEGTVYFVDACNILPKEVKIDGE